MAFYPPNYQIQTPAYPYPTPVMLARPIQKQANKLINNKLNSLVQQLGRQTQMGSNGIVQFNQPLVQAIVSYGAEAVPALENQLRQAIPKMNQASLNKQILFPVIESIFTAQELLKSGVLEARRLYDTTSFLNTHPNPILQIYLAGFYRQLTGRPEAFGPMLSTLMQQSQRQYPQSNPALNPSEEVGGTVLSMIAKASAEETVKQLLPYLSLRPV